jgi:hypothetical protein
MVSPLLQTPWVPWKYRAALDDFDLRGQPARAALIDAVSRIPINSALPELVRAQAALDSGSRGGDATAKSSFLLWLGHGQVLRRGVRAAGRR